MDEKPSQLNSLEDKSFKLRQSFLEFPVEKQEVDYKEGIEFKPKEVGFAQKLVRHILGMCNAGGGYLVIGYIENSKKELEPQELDEKIISTYDPSILAQCVEKFTAGTERINLKIHKEKHPKTGYIYPIIEVEGFDKVPFFCKSSSGILQEDALYLRVASARTVRVATPDDWNKLIDKCVEKRHDEILSRFANLLKEMGMPKTLLPIEPVAIKDEWLENKREEFKQVCKDNDVAFEGLEIYHRLTNSKQKWSQTDLLNAAEKAVLKNTGYPIAFVTYDERAKPKPEKDGIKTIITNKFFGFDLWAMSIEGKFYFFRRNEEEKEPDPFFGETTSYKGYFLFDTKIWRIAEAVDHCIALYKALAVEPERTIILNIKNSGLKDKVLSASHPGRRSIMRQRQANVDTFEWEREMSLDFLQANRKDIIIEICKDIFALFDFWDPGRGLIEGFIAEFDNSRI